MKPFTFSPDKYGNGNPYYDFMKLTFYLGILSWKFMGNRNGFVQPSPGTCTLLTYLWRSALQWKTRVEVPKDSRVESVFPCDGKTTGDIWRNTAVVFIEILNTLTEMISGSLNTQHCLCSLNMFNRFQFFKSASIQEAGKSGFSSLSPTDHMGICSVCW